MVPSWQYHAYVLLARKKAEILGFLLRYSLFLYYYWFSQNIKNGLRKYFVFLTNLSCENELSSSTVCHSVLILLLSSWCLSYENELLSSTVCHSVLVLLLSSCFPLGDLLASSMNPLYILFLLLWRCCSECCVTTLRDSSVASYKYIACQRLIT